MNYNIIIKKPALKFIAKQPQKDKARLLSAIYSLPAGDTLRMSSRYELYRLRVGDYRVVYTINDDKLQISVIKAGNRGDIYK